MYNFGRASRPLLRLLLLPLLLPCLLFLSVSAAPSLNAPRADTTTPNQFPTLKPAIIAKVTTIINSIISPPPHPPIFYSYRVFYMDILVFLIL